MPFHSSQHAQTISVQAKSRRHPAQTITDADYADDLALFADSVTEAQSLLHKIEEAAREIGLNVNSDKTWINGLQTDRRGNNIFVRLKDKQSRRIYLPG